MLSSDEAWAISKRMADPCMKALGGVGATVEEWRLSDGASYCRIAGDDDEDLPEGAVLMRVLDIEDFAWVACYEFVILLNMEAMGSRDLGDHERARYTQEALDYCARNPVAGRDLLRTSQDRMGLAGFGERNEPSPGARAVMIRIASEKRFRLLFDRVVRA